MGNYDLFPSIVTGGVLAGPPANTKFVTTPPLQAGLTNFTLDLSIADGDTLHSANIDLLVNDDIIARLPVNAITGEGLHLSFNRELESGDTVSLASGVYTSGGNGVTALYMGSIVATRLR